MLIQHLDSYVDQLNVSIALLAPSRVRQLEWLRDDLNIVCRNQITQGGIPGPHKQAWYRITLDRLASIHVPTRIQATVNALKLSIRSTSSGTSLRLYFGQMRIAGNFQVPNVNQQNIAGFPQDLANASLYAVLQRLRDGTYLSDQIPIRIFWHAPANRWIVANNRGFTAHCLAQVRPLRLWPTQFLPNDIEITRLTEIEGHNGIPTFTGYRGGEVNPRRLPSQHMFITPGPNSAQIQEVATVPGHWG
jgi:hypothetical protein